MFNRNSKCRLVAISLSIMSLGCPVVSYASPIEPGYDLLETIDGTFIDLTSIGCQKIDLKGNPALLASEDIGPTDTIVYRKQGINPFEAPNGEGTIEIELVALSLKSIQPFDASCIDKTKLPETVTIPEIPAGTMVDLYLTINTDKSNRPNLPQPDSLTPSTGTMTIKHINPDGLPSQGSFNATFNVYADLIFVAAGSNIDGNLDFSDPNNLPISMPDPIYNPLVMTSTGYWTHIKPDVDHHNTEYPAGKFYITEINHEGPHQAEQTLVTLVENSFTATPSDGTIFIGWKTATEIDNAGFFLWRGQLKTQIPQCSFKVEDYSEAKKITPLIPAQGSGTYYLYLDDKVASGNTYCYLLEDIELNGKNTFHVKDMISAKVQ